MFPTILYISDPNLALAIPKMEMNVNYMRKTVSLAQFSLIEKLDRHYHEVGRRLNGISLLVDQWVRSYFYSE